MITILFASLRMFIKSLPVPWLYKLGYLIGWIINALPLKEKKIAQYQLKKILKIQDYKGTTQRMFQSLAYTAIESLLIKEFLKGKAEISFEERRLFEEFIAAPCGKLLLTGHFSNWELLAGVVASISPQPKVIGRAARNKALNEELRKIRESYGVMVLDKDDKTTGFTVLKALKKNGLVGALIDQDTEVLSIFAPFLGMPAKTPLALVDTAFKTKSKIGAIFIEREGPAKFRIGFSDLSNLKNELEVLTEYNSILEGRIKKCPEQWVWVHKRWRSLPDGRTLRTHEYLRYLDQL